MTKQEWAISIRCLMYRYFGFDISIYHIKLWSEVIQRISIFFDHIKFTVFFTVQHKFNLENLLYLKKYQSPKFWHRRTGQFFMCQMRQVCGCHKFIFMLGFPQNFRLSFPLLPSCYLLTFLLFITLLSSARSSVRAASANGQRFPFGVLGPQRYNISIQFQTPANGQYFLFLCTLFKTKVQNIKKISRVLILFGLISPDVLRKN